jgi:transcriptional regulator with XRE-family HTH domain
MSEKSVFSQNLVKARNLKGLTQEEASAKIRIKRSTLGAYEEDRAFPSADTLSAIAEVYNFEDDLYGFINNKDFYDNKGRRRNLRKLSEIERRYHSLKPSLRQAVDAIMGVALKEESN